MVRRRAGAFWATAFVWLAACSSDASMGCGATPTEFETPQATVQSLFRAYGVASMTEDEIRGRLQAQEQFGLVDEALYRACFTKWRGDHDDGLGGYVFGRLVVRKDHLVVEQHGDMATVTTEGETPGIGGVVLRKLGRQWKIDMLASVPEEVRQRLYDVYRRADRRERGARTAE